MINAKKIYNELLDNEELKTLIDEDSIFDSYPNEVTVFPCVIFLDQNQREIEFADNWNLANELSVQVHIFTKALENYPTTSEIGLIVNKIFRTDLWSCQSNGEFTDVDDSIRHRVMTFSKKILL